ncbi:uncharacterized protein CEXT_116011 [Caerostris extrusa]|uniref:Uncharacterized protein n=1 Tax=Caerostris extrusa TaxID=172846 RepID=A0AAV4YG70_CAEEX|nr:uncharacterized protein CEXT_116011 [Caerostris extrusa]
MFSLREEDIKSRSDYPDIDDLSSFFDFDLGTTIESNEKDYPSRYGRPNTSVLGEGEEVVTISVNDSKAVISQAVVGPYQVSVVDANSPMLSELGAASVPSATYAENPRPDYPQRGYSPNHQHQHQHPPNTHSYEGHHHGPPDHTERQYRPNDYYPADNHPPPRNYGPAPALAQPPPQGSYDAKKVTQLSKTPLINTRLVTIMDNHLLPNHNLHTTSIHHKHTINILHHPITTIQLHNLLMLQSEALKNPGGKFPLPNILIGMTNRTKNQNTAHTMYTLHILHQYPIAIHHPTQFLNTRNPRMDLQTNLDTVMPLTPNLKQLTVLHHLHPVSINLKNQVTIPHQDILLPLPKLHQELELLSYASPSHHHHESYSESSKPGITIRFKGQISISPWRWWRWWTEHSC